jgi:hypothetical protein
MPNYKPNTSGLQPFKKGHDERREGNGRKAYADLREKIEAGISTDEIVNFIKGRLQAGDIRALQEVFKVCGIYSFANEVSTDDEVIELRFVAAELPQRSAVCG